MKLPTYRDHDRVCLNLGTAIPQRNERALSANQIFNHMPRPTYADYEARRDGLGRLGGRWDGGSDCCAGGGSIQKLPVGRMISLPIFYFTAAYMALFCAGYWLGWLWYEHDWLEIFLFYIVVDELFVQSRKSEADRLIARIKAENLHGDAWK